MSSFYDYHATRHTRKKEGAVCADCEQRILIGDSYLCVRNLEGSRRNRNKKPIVNETSMSIRTRIWLWNAIRKLKKQMKVILRMPADQSLQRITQIRWHICQQSEDTPLQAVILQFLDKMEEVIRSRSDSKTP